MSANCWFKLEFYLVQGKQIIQDLSSSLLEVENEVNFSRMYNGQKELKISIQLIFFLKEVCTLLKQVQFSHNQG